MRLLSVTCGRTPACECQTTDRYFLETWFIGRKCAASGTRPCKPGPARPIPVHLSMGALPESPFLASGPSGWRDRLFFSPRIQMAHPFLSGSTSRSELSPSRRQSAPSTSLRSVNAAPWIVAFTTPNGRASPPSVALDYWGRLRRRSHSPRAERIKVKPPSPPSAQSVQTKKKPPGDLAISP